MYIYCTSHFLCRACRGRPAKKCLFNLPGLCCAGAQIGEYIGDTAPPPRADDAGEARKEDIGSASGLMSAAEQMFTKDVVFDTFMPLLLSRDGLHMVRVHSLVFPVPRNPVTPYC